MKPEQRQAALRLASLARRVGNQADEEAADVLLALADEPVAEQVRWLDPETGEVCPFAPPAGSDLIPLYAAPPAPQVSQYTDITGGCTPDSGVTVRREVRRWPLDAPQPVAEPSKNDALKLADSMMSIECWNSTGPKVLMERSAAELRRLYAEVERLREELAVLRADNTLTIAHMDGAHMERKRTQALREEITALREAAQPVLELVDKLSRFDWCSALHHTQRDRHGIGAAECPVAQRAMQDIERLRAALEAGK